MKLATLFHTCLAVVKASCITENMDILLPLMLNPACPKILESSEFFDIEAMAQDTDRFCYSCYQEMDAAFDTLIGECTEDMRLVQALAESKSTISRLCTLKDDEHCGSYMQLFSNCNLDDEELECTSACRSSLNFIRDYDSCCLRDLSDIFSEWGYYEEGTMSDLYSKCGIDSKSLCSRRSSEGRRDEFDQVEKLIALLIIKTWSRYF